MAHAVGFWFDEDEADLRIQFWENALTHAKGTAAVGQGKPFVLAPWQRALVGCVFGWKDENGLRRYREVFLYVPKKAGKTSLAAGFLLTTMYLDPGSGLDCYSAAATRDQAAIVFDMAASMVKQCAHLNGMSRVYGLNGMSARSIIIKGDKTRKGKASYKPLAADADAADGLMPHCIVVDELHRHKNGELTEVLVNSAAARAEPLTFYTTTADYNRPSVCNRMLAYAREVRDNGGDPEKPGHNARFLPVIYELTVEEAFAQVDTPDGPKEAWQLPETWRKVNPNLGLTVTEDWFADKVGKVKDSPAELNNFLRLHLNVVTDSDVGWLDPSRWEACKGDWSPADLEGDLCFVGVDMSSVKDLTAVVLVFPVFENGEFSPESGRYRIVPHFWVPNKSAVKKERDDKVPYMAWERAGWVNLTKNDTIEHESILHFLLDLQTRYEVAQIAIDPWQAKYLEEQLEKAGAPAMLFEQTFRNISAPAKELEAAMLDGRLEHDGNACLAWNAGNVVIERNDREDIRPSKRKSTTRIDGIVAAIMGIGAAMAYEEWGEEYDSAADSFEWI